MVLPVAAMIALAAITSAAKVGSEYYSSKKAQKNSKRQAKESKRETLAENLNNALKNKSELHINHLANRKKMAQRKTSTIQDTGEIVKGAFK